MMSDEEWKLIKMMANMLDAQNKALQGLAQAVAALGMVVADLRVESDSE